MSLAEVIDHLSKKRYLSDIVVSINDEFPALVLAYLDVDFDEQFFLGRPLRLNEGEGLQVFIVPRFFVVLADVDSSSQIYFSSFSFFSK